MGLSPSQSVCGCEARAGASAAGTPPVLVLGAALLWRLQSSPAGREGSCSLAAPSLVEVLGNLPAGSI